MQINKKRFIFFIVNVFFVFSLYSQTDSSKIIIDTNNLIVKDTIIIKMDTVFENEPEIFYDTINDPNSDVPIINMSVKVISDKIRKHINDSTFSKFDTIIKKTPEIFIKYKNKLYKTVDTIIILSDEDLYDIDLENIDEISAFGEMTELEKEISEITSLSASNLSIHSIPNAVTVLTKEEIRKSGARDLTDILNMVPGFHFALDENGRVGLGIRGNWANEGKVLMLIDGQEVNDIYTAKLYFGNHYPVDFIEKIEIIRGPGSSIYGGFAEFGVINIITKSYENQKGISFGYTSGKTSENTIRRNFNLYIAKKINELEVNFQYFWGRGQRSNSDYFSYYMSPQNVIGATYSLKGQSDINPHYTNLFLKYKNWSFRSIGDFYKVKNINWLDESGNRTIKTGYRQNYSELKYQFKIGEKAEFIPRINTITQFLVTDGIPNQEKTSQDIIFRPKFTLNFNYNITHRIRLVMGSEAFSDLYQVDSDNMERFMVNYDKKYYLSYAAYGQLIWRTRLFHLTLGGRYDKNNNFGENYTPRIGITKRFRNFHYKLMYGSGLRVPTIGNINSAFDGTYVFNEDTTKFLRFGQKLAPEQTDFIELEFGYKINRKTYLTANFYDISTKNPIVYYYHHDTLLNNMMNSYNETFFYNSKFYSNFDKSGTFGFELALKFKDYWGMFDISYSYYSTVEKSKIPVNTISSFSLNSDDRILARRDMLLAFPKHRLNAYGLFYFSEKFSISMMYNFISSAYAYKTYEDENNPLMLDGRLIKYRPAFTTNFFFNFKSFIFNGLDISFGIYDLFNSKPPYIQPYFGLDNPLPTNSRELVFKISFDFGHKKNRPKKKNFNK